MNRGYVKLWRKSLDGGWLRNPNLWAFWCYCLMKATYKECKVLIGFQEVVLRPGQFIFGRKKCSIETGLSEKTVRTCLQTLKSASNLAIKTASKYSIVSIVNWDIYQGDDLEDGQQNGQQNGQQGASKGPARGHIQEYKEVKNVKKKNNTCSFDPDFDLFWSAYPKGRRVGKLKAMKAWESHNGNMPEISEILKKLEELKNSEQWKDEGGRFIPHPTTWINRGGWFDEVSTRRSKAPTWGDYDKALAESKSKQE